MLFVVDIDQTIGTGVDAPGLPKAIKHYRDRGIVIPETIRDFISLFQMPQVMRIHEVIPGAVEGVKRLASIGRIAYYTVRQPTPETIKATHHWLAGNGFPNPGSVVFCRSVQHKLLNLYEYERDGDEAMLLIDDRYEKLVSILCNFAESQDRQEIVECFRRRLRVFGFGAKTVPECSVVPLLALPSWSGVDALIASLGIAQVGQC